MTDAIATPTSTRGSSLSDIRFVRHYPHSPQKVWRALTDPALMALWGMRPEGFAPVVGTRFKLIGEPNPRWRGFVECQVLEAREPSVLRCSWIGDDSGAITFIQYTLEPRDAGTQLTFEHSGFTGFGGFLLAKLIMRTGWKKMLASAFPAVLADLDQSGALKPGSTLKPRF